MRVTLFTTAVLYMTFLIASDVYCKQHHHKGKGSTNTCGSNYTEPFGRITFNNGSSGMFPEDQTCDWHISGNGTIFLVFDLYMMEADMIKIDGVLLDLPKTGITPYLTDKKNLTVTVISSNDKPNPDRDLKIFYSTISECNYTLSTQSTGEIHSLLYDPQEITTFPRTCNFTIIPINKGENKLNLWIKDFNFTTSTLAISGSSSHDGEYNTTNFPNLEFLIDKQLTMGVTIKNKTAYPEAFVAYFDQVSAACGEIRSVKEGGQPYSITLPMAQQKFIATNQQTLTCRWLIDADEGKTMTISVTNNTVTSAMDQIIILDGPNRFSPMLLDVNSANNPKEPKLFSTGNHLWVSVSTPFFNESFNVQMTVDVTTGGGHMRDKGNVSVKGDSTFLLEVEDGKQVQFFCDSSTAVKESAVLKFYPDFTLSGEPFYTMSAGKKVDSVIVSPTGKMGLVITNFGSSSFSGNFTGIQQGCYKYGQASGDTFSVTGHCNSTCAWIVKPVASSQDLLTFHFRTLNLEENDHVLIQQLDANQTKIANLSFGQSAFPDLWLPAVNGAFVQVNRGSCSVNETNSIAIQSSYQVIPGCETVLRPKLGETVSITSPGYPNNYPLGSNCAWVVVKPPTNESFFLISFKDIQLAQKEHELKIFANKGINISLIAEFNGTNFNSTKRTLPDDILISGNIMVNFTTNTKEPLDSRPGFSLDILVVENGAGTVMTNSSGKMETPGFPKPVNNSALFAWMVEINSTVDEKQIIEFAFSNQTNQTGIEKVLKVYDGASLRSDVLANYSNEVLSRSNQLLFIYQKMGNESGPAFSVSYHNFPCNKSMMCENGVCMHEDWACNGLNDCGDYSDEKNCDGGGYVPPTPAPAPTPPPRDGSKGFSTAGLAVGILIALVIGILLGILAPPAYRKLKNRGTFQSYSSFSNTME